MNTQCGYDVRDDELVRHCQLKCLNYVPILSLFVKVDDPGTRIYTKGCVDAGEDWFNDNLVPVAATLVVVAILQVSKKYSIVCIFIL